MTDYKNRFGTVTSTGSENVLDFEAIDPRASMQSHRTGEQHDSTVVFNAANDINDTVQVRIQDSADGTTFSDIFTGPYIGTGVKAGNFALIPMPKNHRRYVRVILGVNRPGVTAFLEPGPSQPR